MNKISLSQALKTKNRLAGEYVRLSQILQRENSRRNDNPSKVDCATIFTEIDNVTVKLATIKSKIAAGNINIYPDLEKMAELKTRIAFINSLNKREGEEVQYFGHNQEKMVYAHKSFINQEQADKLIQEYQQTINDLQDKIDSYNSNNYIEI